MQKARSLAKSPNAIAAIADIKLRLSDALALCQSWFVWEFGLQVVSSQFTRAGEKARWKLPLLEPQRSARRVRLEKGIKDDDFQQST